MPPLPRCCRAASVALSQPLPPSCLPAVSLHFHRFPLSAAAVLPPPPPSTTVAAPPWLCLCRTGSAALPLYCSSATTALPLTLPCCRCAAAAALLPCGHLCAAAAALMQTLPLPCCLRRHCSAAPSNANVLPPCHHDHVLILCAQHTSHLHLSKLPIYLFCAADSRTIQNQNLYAIQMYPNLTVPSTTRPPLLLTFILFFPGSPPEGYLPENPPFFCYLYEGHIFYHEKAQRPNFLLMKKIVVVSSVSRDYSENFRNQW
jgi:hypothetical protein